MSRSRAVALVGVMLTVVACGSESSGPGPVSTVTISPAEDTLIALGATLQLRAVARDASGDTLPQFFLWRSSAPNVVSIDDTGFATALTTGAAAITAIAFTGQADTAFLLVVQEVATIVVTGDSLRLGSSAPFQAVARDGNDSTIPGLTFTWSSSDTSVATIATDGVATARGLGTTTIRAATDGVTGEAELRIQAHYYVQAVTGDDAGPGTETAPFRTITHALAVADSGNTIKVLPGNYVTAGSGGAESHPFEGPPGVILLGDEATKGGGATPTIVGRRNGGNPGGDPLFLPPANAVIAGFTIVDSAGPGLPSIFITEEGFVFRNNRIIYSVGGGMFVGADSASITDNLISSKIGFFGIRMCGRMARRFEGNTITGNSYGIFAECSLTLNVGVGGRPNVFACNTDTDVSIQNGVFTAVNNLWDHVPPTTAATSTPSGGVDIAFATGGSAVTTGAGLAPNPCP